MLSALEREIDRLVGSARVYSVEWGGWAPSAGGFVVVRGKRRKVLIRRDFDNRTEARIFWEAGRAVLAQRERLIRGWREFFERTGGIS